MDRDTFIITVYCLVKEHYRHLTAYGYCAAKQLHYYGFKLGLRVTARHAVRLDYPLPAPGSPPPRH